MSSEPTNDRNFITQTAAKKLGEVVTWYKGLPRGRRGNETGPIGADNDQWYLGQAQTVIIAGSSGKVALMAGMKGQEASTTWTVSAYSRSNTLQVGDFCLFKQVDQGYEIYSPPPPLAVINAGPPCLCQPCLAMNANINAWIVSKPGGLAIGTFGTGGPSTTNNITMNTTTDPVTVTFPAVGSTPSYSYICPRNQWSQYCPNTLTISAPQGSPIGAACYMCASPTTAIYDGYCGSCPTVSISPSGFPAPYDIFNGTFEFPLLAGQVDGINYTCGQGIAIPDLPAGTTAGVLIYFGIANYYTRNPDPTQPGWYTVGVSLTVQLGYEGPGYASGGGPLMSYYQYTSPIGPLPCSGPIVTQLPEISYGIPGSPTNGNGQLGGAGWGNLYAQVVANCNTPLTVTLT